MYCMNKKEREGILKELHRKPAPKHFPMRKILSYNVNDLWAMDLAEMPKCEGYMYIMVVVDVFSRYAMCLPIKNKDRNAVLTAFRAIVKANGKPKYMVSDMGGEFINKTMKSYLDEESIKLYHIYGTSKASTAERFIRTLKGRLYKEMEVEDTKDWVKLLPATVKDYNATKHSTLGMTPNEAKEKGNRLKVLKETLPPENPPLEKPTLKLGEKVRLSLVKNKFEKGHTKNWSEEVYTITGIRFTTPITYKVSDAAGETIQGSFYRQELQPTKYADVVLGKDKVMAKPKDFFEIERVLDAEEGQFDGYPMVMLKIKWKGLTVKENEALPHDKLYIPYINLHFDGKGMPDVNIQRVLKENKLFTKAQKLKKEFFAGKEKEARKKQGEDKKQKKAVKAKVKVMVKPEKKQVVSDYGLRSRAARASG